MYNKAEVCVFHTTVKPETSGSKIFKGKEIVDIEELHRCLLDPSKFVVVCNDVSAYSEATEKQMFIVTDKLVAEEGYADTFTFSHLGRSMATSTDRKIIMSFSPIGSEPVLKATYFNN